MIVRSEGYALVILLTTHVRNLCSQCAVRGDDNIVLLNGPFVLETTLTVMNEDPKTAIGCHFNLRLPLGEQRDRRHLTRAIVRHGSKQQN